MISVNRRLSVFKDSFIPTGILVTASGKQLQPHWMQTNSPLVSRYMLPPMHRGQCTHERCPTEWAVTVLAVVFAIEWLIRSFISVVIAYSFIPDESYLLLIPYWCNSALGVRHKRSVVINQEFHFFEPEVSVGDWFSLVVLQWGLQLYWKNVYLWVLKTVCSQIPVR